MGVLKCFFCTVANSLCTQQIETTQKLHCAPEHGSGMGGADGWVTRCIRRPEFCANLRCRYHTLLAHHGPALGGTPGTTLPLVP